MAATSGDQMLDASGNRILDASGNAQLSDGAGDTCCCVPCNFSVCGGSTPSTKTALFTGFTRCTGCLIAGGSFSAGGLSYTLDGTFDLSCVAVGSFPLAFLDALWRYTEIGGPWGTLYDNDDCTVFANSYPIDLLVIEFYVRGGAFAFLRAALTNSGLFISNRLIVEGFYPTVQLFNDSVGGFSSCAATYTGTQPACTTGYGNGDGTGSVS